MTCDSESVESWTAHLLRSIASRWVFLISVDASARSQNVAISWNINTSQQLRQWAIDQSDKIIKMLIELRDQRDMTLKLNEQWIDVQVDHIKRLDELEINQVTIDTQEETIVKLRKKVLSLKRDSVQRISLDLDSLRNLELLSRTILDESRLLYSTMIITSSLSFRTHLYSLMKMNQHETAEESR